GQNLVYPGETFSGREQSRRPGKPARLNRTVDASFLFTLADTPSARRTHAPKNVQATTPHNLQPFKEEFRLWPRSSTRRRNQSRSTHDDRRCRLPLGCNHRDKPSCLRSSARREGDITLQCPHADAEDNRCPARAVPAC